MRPFSEKLLSLSSKELSSSGCAMNCEKLFNSSLSAELDMLLTEKNGFYSFESALHVFPYDTTENEIGLVDWNNTKLWISSYGDMAIDALYFAEDIFGGQFCLKRDGVYYFDPETAKFDIVAPDINNWCKLLLSDYEVMTGYPIAHEWQISYGVIPRGARLVPKIPFVAGGAYELDNLYVCSSWESLKARAYIAEQIRTVPDGSKIKIITK
ncbi:hypothetical protein PT277_05050 [Acetobacteraceae bacterium ESL0709]|nr:hypothetical protein [Acetobacteraceae bacterium ESL0697]MDF7678062.1 hypothetical protein [Acetobacteraceae bacterium ESL0709]